MTVRGVGVEAGVGRRVSRGAVQHRAGGVEVEGRAQVAVGGGGNERMEDTRSLRHSQTACPTSERDLLGAALAQVARQLAIASPALRAPSILNDALYSRSNHLGDLVNHLLQILGLFQTRLLSCRTILGLLLLGLEVLGLGSVLLLLFLDNLLLLRRVSACL